MKKEDDLEYPRLYLYRRIVQAKLFMDNHYSEKINLNHIAGEAYFSRFHFIRLFRHAYDKTPHQYLISLRIEKAKDLLKDSRLSISDICFEVGFESVGSFTSLFKRYTGLTPTQYRQAVQERLDTIKTQPLHVVPGCFAKSKSWLKPE